MGRRTMKTIRRWGVHGLLLSFVRGESRTNGYCPHGFARPRVGPAPIQTPLVLALGFSLCLSAALGQTSAAPRDLLRPHTRDEIESLQAEKLTRTPAQRKLDSQLVYALRAKREGVVSRQAVLLRPDLSLESDGRVLVDIKADVSPDLLGFIERGGGAVLNSFPRDHAIRAVVPLNQLETIAARPGVRSIRPADRAVTNAARLAHEGDIAHQADLARRTFPADGTSVRVGVLSDSIDYLTDAQTAGALGNVTILPGQTGNGSGEGTAMLEIVHALAPGSDLYFATAFSGAASFANNIRALYAAGCRIIIDDVTYFSESPFQDGPIALAVDDVCSKGALFFSAAGNSGNMDHGTGGTWEGDFKDGGPATIGRGGRLHDFGGVTYNTVIPGGGSLRRVDLFWADPLGHSTNDYDVYILDSNGSVVRSSTNIQDGQGDPYEAIPTLNIGERIVIVKYAGEDRYLWLSSGRGTLAQATPGSTRGHNAARVANCFTVAATSVGSALEPFTGGSANPVETFSSDGPRRLFFNPDGSAITPGDYSSAGGFLVSKPDFTAADGVTVSVTNLSPFFGTSAAAPHAGAIAALLWSYSPLLTAAAVNHLLTATALDIEGPGQDRDSGAGIVMAYPAVALAPQLTLQSVQLQDANANGYLDANECATVVVTLQNPGTNQALTGISGVLACSTPGVLANPVSTPLSDLAPGASATASFEVSTTPQFTCGTNASLTLQVAAAGNLTFAVPFQLNSIIPLSPPTRFASTTGPTPIPDLGDVTTSLEVSGVSAPLGHVQVAVHITHTYDYDLRLTLITPEGTNIVLSSNNGPGGQNYGSACDDLTNMTVFSDDAPTTIKSATAPFVGIFKPEQPLSSLFGKTGDAVNGTWRLRVEDQVQGDTGTLECWSVQIEPVAPCDGGGQCLIGPSIVHNPAGQAVSAGDTVLFTAQVSGSDPLSYQWFFNVTNSVPGGTNATLTISNVEPGQAGSYQLRASNPYGSVTTTPVQLTVSVVALSLLSSPADQVATNGDHVQLTVAAQGSPPLSYQWYFEGSNLLSGATSSVLKLSPVRVDQSGVYQAVVGNPYNSVTSAPAQLTVVMPPLIVGGPTNQVATNGDLVVLSVEAQGTAPLSYQWYFQWTNQLAGATSNTLSLGPVSPAQAGTYGVVVSNGYGQASNGAVLTVIVLPTISCVNRTVEMGSAWEFDVPAVTGSNTTLTIVGTTTNQGCGQTYSATRSWVVTDGAGYQASCSQTVQVVDTTAPVIACAGDKSVVLGSAWGFDEPVAQDAGMSGVVVYDNWTNNLGQPFGPGSVEVGNQITLAGTQRYASRFGFGYWGSNTVQSGFEGQVEARVRFYRNDGAVVSGGNAAPGTVLYDSGAIGLAVTNNGSVVIENFQSGATVVPLVGALPDAFTWTVQLSGLSGNDTAGLNLFGPPVTGDVRNDYWANSTGGWSLQTNNAGSDFGAQLTAVSQGVTLTVLSTITNASCGNGFNAARAWQAVDACGNASVCTQIVAVVDQSTPRILSQSQDLSVPSGQTATLNITVSACPPLTYQWFFEETNVVADGTSSALELNNVTDSQAGSYQVVVGNPYGSVTSAPIELTVVLPLTITANPSDETVNPGDAAGFIASAQGAPPLTYQWYFNQTIPVTGGTTSTLALNNVTLQQAGDYQMVASNPYGSVTSAPARLTVVASPQILSGPADQTATNGDTAFLTVNAQGTPPLTYQWFFNETNSLAPGTGATLTLNNVTPDQAGNYDVVVGNSYGNSTSSPARLTVVVKAAITVGPASQTATNGGTVAFSVLAQGTTPLAYQWYFNQTQSLAGATSSTLSLSPVTASQAGSYLVVVSNPYASVTSAPAQLAVNVPATILSGPTNQVVQSGTNVIFVVNAQGSDPLVYQWYFNATNQLTGATNAILSLPGVTNQNSGDYSASVSNAFGFGVSQPANLRVLVPTQLISLTRSQNVVALTFSTVPNLIYSVYYNDDFGTTNWLSLPKGTLLPGTGAPITVQDPRASGAYRFYKITVE